MRVAIDSHKVFGCQAMRVDESQSDNIVVFRHWLLHFDLMSEHDIHDNELVRAEKETIPFREGYCNIQHLCLCFENCKKNNQQLVVGTIN